MFNQILISKIRNVMPDIIAQDIVGVQPMFDFTLQTLKTRYDFTEKSFKMNNDYYKFFLRLNNRRKTQTRSDFREAGYPEVKVTLPGNMSAWFNWMDENIGEYNYFYTELAVCFFTSEDLKTLYLLRWS